MAGRAPREGGVMQKKTAPDSRRLTQILADLMLRHQPTPFKPQTHSEETLCLYLHAALWAGGWTKTISCAIAGSHLARNYASELERELDICLERRKKNPDGIGAHMRYRFACRGDVLKVIQFVNRMAAVNQHYGLSKQDIADILNLYPDNFTAA